MSIKLVWMLITLDVGNLDVIVKILSYNSVAFPHLVPSQNYTFGTRFGLYLFSEHFLGQYCQKISSVRFYYLNSYFHNLCLW